jgi:hypothetical protein
MTEFERTKQTIAVFEHAGRIAYAMQIPVANNPYPKTDAQGRPEPAFAAWDRGYALAGEETFQKARPARPVVARKPSPTFKQPSQPSRPANHPRWKGGPMPEVRRGR